MVLNSASVPVAPLLTMSLTSSAQPCLVSRRPSTIVAGWHPLQTTSKVFLPGPSGSCDAFEPAKEGLPQRKKTEAKMVPRFQAALSIPSLCPARRLTKYATSSVK